MREFELIDSIVGIARDRSLCHNSGVQLIWQPVAPVFLAPRFITRSLVFFWRVQTAGTGQKVAVRATRLKEYMGKNRISNVSASTMQNFFKPMNRDD